MILNLLASVFHYLTSNWVDVQSQMASNRRRQSEMEYVYMKYT